MSLDHVPERIAYKGEEFGGFDPLFAAVSVSVSEPENLAHENPSLTLNHQQKQQENGEEYDGLDPFFAPEPENFAHENPSPTLNHQQKQQENDENGEENDGLDPLFAAVPGPEHLAHKNEEKGEESDGLDPFIVPGPEHLAHKNNSPTHNQQQQNQEENGEESDGLDPLFAPGPGPEPEHLAHENPAPILNNQQEGENDENSEEFSDGLDPLFGEPKVKRVLDFGTGYGEGEDEDEVFEGEKELKSDFDLGDFKEKKKRTKRGLKGSDVLIRKEKRVPIRNEKRERKVRQAQQADFQRVMRERKGVGFKPAPMVEKSISSVLQKIKQRKIEVFQKVMPSKVIELDGDSEKDEFVKDILDGSRSLNAVETGTDTAPVSREVEKDLHLSDKENTTENLLADETTQLFRAPINDTQDLFVDSERSFPVGDDSNESSSPAEDITPSAPSMNLQLDSGFADDISSSDEESDKENVDPHPKHMSRGNSAAIGDPVKEFMDEEALEDDSDNDRFQDKDEEDMFDMEEHCDYIATDVVEKRHDREKNNLYHQQWQQQQDEAGTEKILQKLNCGMKSGMKREATYLDDEDAERTEDEGDESDKNVASQKDEGDESDNDPAYDDDEKGYVASGVTTKKLRQMIPLMFTDKDDVYVSSEDEETERSVSKQYLLKQRGMQQKSKIMSPADKTSAEVFSRIKKVNVMPEAKKKKITSFFDPLHVKDSSNNSSKSSFLRRATSHSGSSKLRRGSSTGRSYIFGRDDSNSRSSMSLPDEAPSLDQQETQAKKNGTAKYVSSQGKLSTQQTQVETPYSGKSLFEMLKCSSVQTSYETSENIVVEDQLQAVFSAFKTGKKQTTKIK